MLAPPVAAATPSTSIRCKSASTTGRAEVGPPGFQRGQKVVQEMLHAALPAGQVEGCVRAHQRPAQAGAFADGGIDIGDGGDTLGDQMHRLAPQRRLQAVGEVAGDFLADLDRVLADGPVERHRRGDGLGAGLGTAHHLDQRDQMRRVEGVADHHAPGMRAGFRQARGEQAGGGGGDHHIGRQRGIEAGEQRLLHLEAFGRAFLDEIGTFQRGHGVGLEAPGIGLRIGQAAQAHQDGPGILDHAANAGRGRRAMGRSPSPRGRG